ncbi:beta-ketoacyl synthase N-terminal-like domain-containing protein [Streptomyces sp. DH37]|uniref:beta-ketoacyl synthase N-terminal-like domain-containing protein n=1 Tax=Streptomyces sp. DH37 TaxID=3040122 RepID=UPI0024436BAF|nr:beta-ketoacyl synthase N-terminal-like domain-containing protein [Streptomyces sp. DH37]MDG9702016.1 beta-ketoacyl synthase N-terminal-like domain-containing protein [Streptomyces sp. DH37]
MVQPQQPPARKLSDTPVAIVGLGALFPRSGDLNEFWQNIAEGNDCIEEVPETHWKISDYYDPDPSVPDKTYAKRGGFIPTVPFSPLEFGLPPNTLEVTDVLQLLSLMVAKQTLKDAGAPGSQWYDPSRTGCILGVTGANSLTQPLATRLQTPVLKEVVRSCGLSERDAEEIADKFTKAFAPWEENSFPGMLGNVVAGRIANRFDLGATNCTVDAACASSLAAVRMAVSELVSGRADLMLTGGCDAENTILMYMCFSKTPAFSRSGRIRPFDEESDGTLIGEGLGMLALKRLADAERDGDRVYAVLRGIGTSSDGRFKSIYAPRKEGQVTALRRAYEDAGFGPEQVGLVECHGTGTHVGDLTELSALREVYAEATGERQFAAVGSVKSQIGHTKAAAGAAGLIKLSLALHQKVLPPTINVERPREAVDFPNSPFYVNTLAQPWIADPARERRRAAVSSFGFGGTNFHCVLEEHDPGGEGLAVLAPAARVHVWHAEGPQALLDLLESDAAPADGTEPVPAGHARLALVASGAEEAAELRAAAARELRARPDAEEFALPRGAYYRRTALLGGGTGEGAEEGARAKVAALFAGQGSQYLRMGLRTAMAVPPVRAAFDAAAAEFAGAEPLGRTVFPPPAFDDATRAAQDAALRRTDYAQPAIGALSAGQYRYLAELGFAPDGVLGHSFGELTALWAAGSIGDQDLHRLARARGRAMALRPEGAEDPGTMAAVSATAEEVERIAADHKDIEVCNVNAPDQVVVGGGTEAVRAFVAACAAEGLTARELPVAAAFHTRYVAHAVAGFREAVESVKVRPPAVPVYADTPGASYGRRIAGNRDVLVGQLTSPVHFAPRVTEMYEDGFRVFVEFGPKSVLSGLVRRTLADREDVVVLSADPGPKGDGDRALKQLAARLLVLGAPLTECNRYTADIEPARPAEGMTIPLNGVNHVSEQRKQAYQDALGNGYRVEAAAAPAAQVPAVPQEQQAVPVAAAPAGQGGAPAPAGLPGTGAVAWEHLSMHREYLGSQLRVAERLTNLLDGSPSDNVLTGITAISQQSVAIGQSHAQASEVLRSFVLLESGVAPGPADAYAYAPAPAAMPAPALAPAAVPYAPAPAPAYEEPPVPAPAPAPAPAYEEPPVPAPAPTYEEPAAPAPQQTAPAAPEPAPSAAPAAPAAPAAVTEEDVRKALLESVAEKTGYPVDMLETSMDVEADLGIDSIKRVEIMGSLRDRFPGSASADPEKLAELRTLDDIIAFVSGAAGAAAGAEEVMAAPKA